ncbi:hypothetical protein AAG906_033692 [Vitis piasezkii]
MPTNNSLATNYFQDMSFNNMVSHQERATTTISSYWTWWWEATSKKDLEKNSSIAAWPSWLANSWISPISGFQSASFICRIVARDQDIIFANRDTPVAALITSYGRLDIAWSPYGSYWRNLRKLFVREMLSNNILDRCHAHRRYEVRKTITNVYNKIGTPMDIGKLSFQTELNVMTRSLWGNTIEGLEDSVTAVSFRELSNEMMRWLGKPNISDFFQCLLGLIYKAWKEK